MPKKTFLGGQKNWLIFSLGMYHYRKDINGEQVQDEAGHLLHHTALDPNGRTWKRPAKNVRVPDWPPHDRKKSKCLRTSMWFSYLKDLGRASQGIWGGGSLETFLGGASEKNTLYEHVWEDTSLQQVRVPLICRKRTGSLDTVDRDTQHEKPLPIRQRRKGLDSPDRSR